jgi:hypothetical protein
MWCLIERGRRVEGDHKVILSIAPAAELVAGGTASEGVGDEMLSGLGAEASGVAARVESAEDSAGGSSRPRFAARFKIPRAALGESEYLSDTCFCRTADKEHATATLSHSEVARVQHPPADSRPAFP